MSIKDILFLIQVLLMIIFLIIEANLARKKSENRKLAEEIYENIKLFNISNKLDSIKNDLGEVRNLNVEVMDDLDELKDLSKEVFK